MAKSDSTRHFGCIYLVTNKANGKVYVGQTTMPIEVRWSKHCLKSQYRSRLNCAIEKYGKDSFSITVLAYGDSRESLNAMEIEFIARLNATNSKIGYNVTPGGGGGIRTPEAAEKGAKKLRGRPLSEETRKKIAAAKTGKKQSPEHIKAMVEAKLASGFRHSDSSKKKMSEAKKGIKLPAFSDEHRRKLSESARRQWHENRGHTKRLVA